MRNIFSTTPASHPLNSSLLLVGEMNQTTTPKPPSCVNYGALQTPLAVLYSIIFVLGLVGNLVALWVFFCVHSKKNSVRVFLINVALADLLLVACLPFRILYHSQGNEWKLSPTLCKIVGNLFYMNMYISVVLLGLISVDRYERIHRAAGMQHRLRSTRWSSVLCAVVWIVGSAISLCLVTSNSQQRTDDDDRCFHYKQLLNAKWKAHVNIGIVVFFWLVFISLVVSYGKIALKLQRTSREQPDLPNAHRYTRTARKSFFILFLFTVCFAPYHTVRLFYIKTQISNTPCFWQNVADEANEVTLVFSALNSCLDPVMYFLLSSSVRKEVLHLLSNMCCVRDVAGVSGSSSSTEMDAKNGRQMPPVSHSKDKTVSKCSTDGLVEATPPVRLLAAAESVKYGPAATPAVGLSRLSPHTNNTCDVI